MAKIIFYTSLVQSVERRFPKPDAVGSSPTRRDQNLDLVNQVKIKKHSLY